MLQVKYRMLSRPARVYWAGFESDTLRLQQAGWELAAEEDIPYDRIRLLMRHQNMKLYALSAYTDYCFQREAYTRGDVPLIFNVVCAAPRMEVHRMAEVGVSSFEAFRQVDAMPQMVSGEIKSIEDFRIFATPLVRTEEIIVEPQSVSAMLERIRELQAPEQKALREKQRLAAAREGLIVGDSRPQQRFHAQIISIEDARLAA
jgi:hypothetical protein